MFLIVALFNNIRTAMPREFSVAIQYAAEARISVKRIEVYKHLQSFSQDQITILNTFFFKEFMLLDEMTTYNTNSGSPIGHSTKLLQLQTASKASKIEFKNVSVKWPVVLSENEESTITNASLKVRPGQLLTVVGSIGSGKV